jgi:hypothetical protein
LGPQLLFDRRDLPLDLSPRAPPALIDRIDLIIFARPGIASAGVLGRLADPAREDPLSGGAREVEIAERHAYDWIGIGLLAVLG